MKSKTGGQTNKTNLKKEQKSNKKNQQTLPQIYINNTWGYRNIRYEQSRKSPQHEIRNTRLYIVQIGFPDFIELVCF